jgi:hypothetical protein
MSKPLNDKRDIICGSHLDCSLSSILCDHPTLFTRVRGKKEDSRKFAVASSTGPAGA